ncbi:MAG: hypothetical protein ACOYNU_13120 [Bacteroidales bacterium]
MAKEPAAGGALSAFIRETMRLAFSLFIAMILFSSISCKKSENENGDTYYFTTKLTWYVKQLPEGTVSHQYDSTIYYTGMLKYETDNKVKIEYCQNLAPNPPYGYSAEGVIYPTVDSAGNLTYPEYWSTWGYYFTGGSIKENGDIQIEMGANLYDRGYHQSISGYKIN